MGSFHDSLVVGIFSLTILRIPMNQVVFHGKQEVFFFVSQVDIAWWRRWDRNRESWVISPYLGDLCHPTYRGSR